MSKQEACEILEACGVEVGADFYALDRERVDALLTEADQAHYRLPKLANGSRARYFHESLQRRAGRVA